MVSGLPRPDRAPAPWQRRYPVGVPATWTMPAVTVPRLLDDAVRDLPDLPALVDEAGALTYLDVRDRVAELVGVLAGLGIVAGDRVSIAADPVSSLLTMLAVWRLGAVAVPIEAAQLRQVPLDEPVPLMTPIAPVALVAGSAEVRDLVGAGIEPRETLLSDDLTWRRPTSRRRWTARVLRGAGRLDERELTARVAGLVGSPMVRPTGPGVTPHGAALLSMGATWTDRASPVGTRHAALVAAAIQTRLWVPDMQAGRERLLVAGDLADPAVLSIGALTGLLSAATLRLAGTDDAAGVARTIEDDRSTIAVLPRAVAMALATDDPARRRDLRSLRVVLVLGRPLPAAAAAALEERTQGARVRAVFGPTPTAPITHAQPVYGRTMMGAIGVPVTATASLVVDPRGPGRTCPAGRPGELYVAGPQVADLRLDPDGQLVGVDTVDGWSPTGEVVVADDDGVFTHLGRSDEVIIVEDRVIVLPRIEAALRGVSGVQDAGAVVDLSTGEVHAAVRTRRRPAVELERIWQAADQLPVGHRPAHLETVDELPRTPAGTLDRAALLERLTRR